VNGFCVETVAVPTSDAERLHKSILEGMQALYHGRFLEARKMFTAITQEHPDDPRGYFLLALTYRWLTRIDPESATYQNLFEEAAALSIDMCKSLIANNKNHADATLYLAASYGYRAEYYNFLKHSWKKAYDDGVKMREYLEKASKFPEISLDIDLGYALYNYYAYLYRDKIGWWRFLLSLPKGDKQKGIDTLEELRYRGIYTQVEAWYFLIEIYKDEKETKELAISLNEQLHQAYPENPFFHTLLAGVYHKFHDWRNSKRVGLDIVMQAEKQPFYSDYLVLQAKYLIGESSFFLGDYDEALPIFNEIISQQPEQPRYLLPWSHLRRGTIYNLKKEPERAKEEFRAVLKMKDIHDVHDLARQLLKSLEKSKT
jgi:tetratricopeptide (TPR) repeat protein